LARRGEKKHLMRTVAYVMWSLAALILLSACTSSRDEHKGAAQAMASVDNGAESVSTYSLLSEANKGRLGEKYKVKTAEQYHVFRQDSEASWSDFVITGSSTEHDGKIIFSGRAKVEETGVAEEVEFRCVLVRQGGNWTVDSYTPIDTPD
jgi:hypothetical protein